MKNKDINRLDTICINEKVKVIFTDFFDTIVSRSCHPEEIKLFWSAEIIDYYNINCSTTTLYKLRNKCEQEICDINLSLNGESELQYSDMIILLYQAICDKFGFKNNLNDFIQKCIEIELRIEKNKQFVNKDVIKFLVKMKKLNKPIFIISDFYLGKDFIYNLLKHHKLESLINDIYVSSDYIKTKRSSNLYKYVISDLNLNTENILMIGDNIHSDKDIPESLGINAIHIPRDMSRYDNSWKNNNQNSFKVAIDDLLRKKKFPFNWSVIGYYLFIKKLQQECDINNIHKINFLAREGQFLKNLFDLYLKHTQKFSNIQTVYFYASRRCTYLPSLYELNIDAFDQLLNQYPSISLENLLASIGLEKNIKKYYQEDPTINFYGKHLNLKLSEDFKKLLKIESFVSDFYSESSTQRSLLRDYTISNLNTDGKLYLVDVGWKGSIQDNINRATNITTVGYYMGLLNNAYISMNNIKYGLLYRAFGRKTTKSCFNEFRTLFEVLSSADHGSVIRYTSKANNVDLDYNQEEEKIYLEYIKPLQKYIEILFIEILKIENIYALSYKEKMKILSSIYEKKCLLPTSDEIKLFYEMEFYENFGLLEHNKLSYKKNIKEKIIFLKNLIKKPRDTISRSFWKPLMFNEYNLGILSYIYFLYKKLSISKKTRG
ncbi:HAD-IA family hydrolase [Avibacterium avium]|uniref:HAD-IA family hydrolase n=2 Tax=Avibacterium avium TaxID=751 RepID=UPI003BF8FF67